jgi:hypothetical protein
MKPGEFFSSNGSLYEISTNHLGQISAACIATSGRTVALLNTRMYISNEDFSEKIAAQEIRPVGRSGLLAFNASNFKSYRYQRLLTFPQPKATTAA